MLNILVLSDYDSRVKWGMSVARRLAPANCIDVVLLPHQAHKVKPYIQDTRHVLFNDKPLHFLRTVHLLEYDALIIALGGGANAKAVSIVRDKTPAGGRRPLLMGGFNGLTDRNDPDVILSRVGLDVVTINCEDDRQSFEHILTTLEADSPTLVVSGYLREYPSRGIHSQENSILFVQQDGVPKSAKAYAYLIEKLQAFVLAHPQARLAIKLRDEKRVGINRANAAYDARGIAETILKNGSADGRIWLDYRDVEEILGECDEVWSVSSTVLLEALALGKRVASISDFGISRYLGNAPLLGSGLLIKLENLSRRDDLAINPIWEAQNVPKTISAEELQTVVQQELVLLAQNSYRFRQPYYTPSPWLNRKPKSRQRKKILGKWAYWRTWQRWLGTFR